MPHMINGFGTWHYGKRNMHACVSACPNCKAVTTLTSYDTRRYITALFLPLIPLDRRRVVFDCPKCRKFRFVPLHEWETKKAQAREEALRLAHDTARGSQDVKEVINALVGFQDPTTFFDIAPVLRQRFAGSSEVLTHVGGAYEFFGSPCEAEETLYQALQVDDTEELREDIARLMLLDLRPDEAAPYLQHILPNAKTGGAPLLHLFVEACQALGRHAEALDLLREAERVFPQTQNDKSWTRLRKLSEKHRATGKAIPSPSLGANRKPPKEQPARWAPFAGPLALIVAVGVYLAVAFTRGDGHEVYLVNGLDRPYAVDIGGRQYTVRPAAPLLVKLPEGKLTVKADALPDSEQPFEIKTNFFTRPFVKRFFVLNPDRLALLAWEATEYMEHPDDTAKYEFRLHTNRLLEEFRAIDFPFLPFPDEVKIPSGGRTLRRRVGVISDWKPVDIARNISKDLGVEALTQYATTRVHANPGDFVFVQILAGLLEPAAFIREVDTELMHRPVYVEVHRAYQELMQATNPGRNLEEEYAGFLAQDPANPELLYLLGRATFDPASAETLFQQAVAANPPSAYAYNALAFNRLADGRFDEALTFVDRATQLSPANESFQSNRREILEANGRFAQLIQEMDQDGRGFPSAFSDLLTQAQFLGQMGKTVAEFDEYMARIVQRARKDGASPQDLKNVEQVLRGEYAYGRGDLDNYLKSIEKTDDPLSVFVAALLADDIEKAREALAKTEPSGMLQLVFYLAAERVGQHEDALQHLTLGIELLRKASREEQLVAACLAGEQTPDSAALCHLTMRPDTKRVLMTVLGVRFPDQQAQYFEMAGKLNYSLAFPHEILKRVLGEPAPNDATPALVGQQSAAAL